MDILKIEAQTRGTGKKAARSTRREGRVPCVLYGRATEAVHFSMDSLALHRLVFTDELHRLSVELEGQAYDCILKSVDMDPVRDEPIHADFQILVAGEAIELDVPISFVGTPVGQTNGGDVQHILHEITVRCLPVDIPDQLEVNVAALDIGDSIHVSELSFENIEIVTPGRQTVVAVTAKRVAEVEPVEALEAQAEGAEAEEGAEGEPEEGEES